MTTAVVPPHTLSSDGVSVVAIGANYNDNTYGENAGHTRVYAWNGTAWVQRSLKQEKPLPQWVPSPSQAIHQLRLADISVGGGSFHDRIYVLGWLLFRHR